MSTVRWKLQSFAELLRGMTPANTVEDGDGAPFFGIAEITQREEATRRYPVPGANLSKAVTLREGDVVIVLLGNSLGASALVTETIAGSLLGRECAAVRIQEPAREIVTPAWLYAWTQSAAFRALAERGAGGAALTRLSISTLGAFEIPVPPVDYQDEATQELAAFDEAITAAERHLELLRALRQVEVDLAISGDQQR